MFPQTNGQLTNLFALRNLQTGLRNRKRHFIIDIRVVWDVFCEHFAKSSDKKDDAWKNNRFLFSLWEQVTINKTRYESGIESGILGVAGRELHQNFRPFDTVQVYFGFYVKWWGYHVLNLV